jgi:hypothetical protein
MNKLLLVVGIIGLSVVTNAQSPSFQWAKQFPNCGDSQGNYGGSCVKVDANGNVYTSGYFSGAVDFDPGAGTSILTSLGNSDMFISKLDASGNFVWAKQIGGLYNDLAYAIALDGAGNVYATGSFMGTVDFDPGSGVANLDGVFGLAFVLKLNTDGKYVWAKNFSSGSSKGYSIATDASNNVYTIGRFVGTVDFDPGSSTTELTSPGVGTGQIYISKLDASGNFVWAKQMGGEYDDYGLSIVLDQEANVYTTGHFSDVADFDPGVGVSNLTTLPGMNEIFISKLNSKGEFVWAKQMGGTGHDRGHAITLDASGNIITTGFFNGTADFDPGTGVASQVAIGGKHIFISKLDASGNYIWVKHIGTATSVSYEGNAVAADAAGNIYVTGYFNANTDFDPGAGTAFSNSNGNDDIFILKLNASGNYVWHQKIGGTTWDSGKSIFVDNLDNIYTTGYFKFTADFDPGTAVVNMTTSNAGNGDVFISKLSQRTTAVNLLGKDNSAEMNVYPNPFTSQTNIVFSEVQRNSTIRIVDILGKEISSIHFSGDRLTLEKGNMKKGIYFIQAIDVAHNISIQKLILQ